MTRDKFIDIQLAVVRRLWEERLPVDWHDKEDVDMLERAYETTCIHLAHIKSRMRGLAIYGLEVTVRQEDDMACKGSKKKGKK